MNCPRCGAELVRENCICPSCEWSIHRVEHPANKYIRYVQSPVSNTVVTLVFLLALAGQLMIVFTGDFFALPFANNLMVAAHVVKTIGETALLFCLMYGLKFEFWRFRFHLALVILMLLAYHLMSAALLTVLDRGMDPNEMASLKGNPVARVKENGHEMWTYRSEECTEIVFFDDRQKVSDLHEFGNCQPAE